jgi:hypothetical protein
MHGTQDRGYAVACVSQGETVETLTTLKTGAKRLSTGSYLMVYRRVTGGKWQIAQQAWIETPAAAASADGAGHS